MITRFCHITEQGIAGGVDMIGNGIFCNRDIFNTAGGAACLRKIYWYSLPEDVMFTFLDLFYVRFKSLVITDRDLLYIIFMGLYFVETMLFTKFCFF